MGGEGGLWTDQGLIPVTVEMEPSGLPYRAIQITVILVTVDGIFPGRVRPVIQKLALQWLPCQAPGVKGSALGLVGPVSAYCDWVR